MTAEQLPAHPRIWWDGHDFLYLRTGSALQAGEDGQLHRRGPGLYRAERVEDILTPEARPVVELHAAAVPDTGQAPEPPAEPARGDDVEAWIKRARDAYSPFDEEGDYFRLLDGLLDDYRLHRVTGTPLTEHACEGPNCCTGRDGGAH
jgi:hypothetical protein